jgi:ATP-dependent Clp protease ATP-binding subunit ClpA
MADRFDRFTESTRRALSLGQEEAERFGHNYFGTEHLLFGLAAERTGSAASVLANLGAQVPKIRAAIDSILGHGLHVISGEIGLTPRAKRAIEAAVTEARRRDHQSIGTAHLLLGLLEDEQNMASRTLVALGVDLAALRAEVVSLLASGDGTDQHPGGQGYAPRQAPPTDPIDFGHFTERARRVLTLAQEEAQRFNHNYIGTEHLLLGLVRERDGIAAHVLGSFGVNLGSVRSAVESITGRGERAIMGEIRLTPRVRTVLALAHDEAQRLHHHYIGTEHLLLGVVREGEGIAAGVLESKGIRLDRLRDRVVQILSAPPTAQQAAPPTAAPSPPRTPEEIAALQTPPGRLLQVIPIVQEQTHGEVTLVFVAIERYEQAFIVTWHLTIESVARHPHPSFAAHAEDDHGNRYRGLLDHSTGGGSPAGPYAGRFAYRFVPALDRAARALTLHLTLPRIPTPGRRLPDSTQLEIAIPPLPAT